MSRIAHGWGLGNTRGGGRQAGHTGAGVLQRLPYDGLSVCPPDVGPTSFDRIGVAHFGKRTTCRRHDLVIAAPMTRGRKASCCAFCVGCHGQGQRGHAERRPKSPRSRLRPGCATPPNDDLDQFLFDRHLDLSRSGPGGSVVLSRALNREPFACSASIRSRWDTGLLEARRRPRFSRPGICILGAVRRGADTHPEAGKPPANRPAGWPVGSARMVQAEKVCHDPLLSATRGGGCQ